jgi:S-adenosylmethionine:tRNA ribosyltransferase-isomerase
MYSLSDFDFNLPQERIAQFPLPDRSASRLLHLDGAQIIDRQFADIVDLLQPGDLLVMNNTRVLKARFFGVKESGGKVEALVERVLDNRTVLAQVRASRRRWPAPSMRLADAFDVTVGERAGEFFTLHFDADVFDLIEAHGRLPLPPYIEHDADSFDENRYQTVFNKVPGAVAAPTAGLHFDEPLLEKLKAKGVNFAYVTLHVGAGTFQPVRTRTCPSTRCIPSGTPCRRKRWMPCARRVRPAATWWPSAPPAARAGIGLAKRPAGGRQRRYGAVHHARLPVQDRDPPDYQFPPAEVDPADAGVGLRRL